MKPWTRSPWVATAVLVGLGTAVAIGSAAVHEGGPTRSDAMSEAARAWVAGLGEEQKKKAVAAWDAPERKAWHFFPMARPGLSLGGMDAAQRRGAHELLRSALSSRGYLKSTSIMDLEDVLRAQEQARGGDGAARDREAYHFTVFGDPAADGPWGWKVEGHHLSLNFAAVGKGVATTPFFLGTAPHEVREGPRAGLTILAEEERLARALLASLDGTQRAAALIADSAPPDILLGPDRKEGLGPPQGLPAARMNGRQREILRALIAEYTGNLAPALAAPRLARIAAGGEDGIHFAWAGASSPGQGHYWRLHGPTFVIEYDNTQNGANHVHTVWRDPENDFGEDLLREHLRTHHAPK